MFKASFNVSRTLNEIYTKLTIKTEKVLNLSKKDYLNGVGNCFFNPYKTNIQLA